MDVSDTSMASSGTTKKITVANLAPVDWLNVVTGFGADPAGVVDSTTVIQNALNAVPAAGGTVYFPAGTYKITAALTVPAGTTLQGTGQASVINQTSTTAAGLSCTDAVGVQIRDLTIEGPSSGSGTGISFTLSGRSNIYQIDMTGLLVKNFGSHGVAAATLIVSSLRRVVSHANGGDGFDLPAGRTSVSFDACYANANTGSGFSLNAQNYTALNGCAADSNGANGYLLTSCSQVTLAGCGAEASTSQAFKVTGGFGTSLISCFCTLNSTIAVWITGGAVAAFVQGFRESSTTGSPTASIQVDGSSTALIGICNVTTATSFANGTTTIVSNNTIQTPGSTGSSSFIINRLAITNIAAVNFQTASVSQWNVQMTSNSTNDLLIRDAANGNVAATFEQHGTGENIQLLSGTKAFGGGIGVIGIANAATTPGSTPSGGGVLYATGGALHGKGSGGTDTVIAPA